MTPYSVAISTMNIWATNGNALNLLAVFFFLNYGVVFTDVGMAWEIFSLRFLREVVNDNILPLQAFPNGSPRAPVAGALLIWDKGGEFKDTGHVAIITQLHGNKVRIAEQNVIHSPLPQGQQWTRELEMVVENGGYTLKDTFDDTTILGWMIQTEDTEYSLPQPEIAGELLKISGARLENKGQFDGKWLDAKDPLQKRLCTGQRSGDQSGSVSLLHHYRERRAGAD